MADFRGSGQVSDFSIGGTDEENIVVVANGVDCPHTGPGGGQD
jgi:hypothetical protein